MDYQIVVPSRKRTHLMANIRKMIPSAFICVEDSEVDAYSAFVPDGLIMPHPELGGLAAVRNWIIEISKAETLIMIDDDFRGVSCALSQRTLKAPDQIRSIIENQIMIATDLDIGVFCWSRSNAGTTTHPAFHHPPSAMPIRFVNPVSSSFGITGKARHRKFDTGLPGRADADFTLQTLLDDRILLADMRYYFNHGQIFSGSGGNVGLIDSSQIQTTTKKLKEKWGKALASSRSNLKKGSGQSIDGYQIRVPRRQTAAVKL